MATSNKRSNGHLNAVMNNTRVQRAVSKVIADQTRAEELLEQLNATSTPADDVDTTAAETPEVPEKTPEASPQSTERLSDEQIFLAAFAAEKTFFKMLINTLAIDEGELYTWLTGLWFKRSSLIKEYRSGNFEALRKILETDEPSFDHALAVKHVVWLLPLVQAKAEEKLAAYGEFAVLLGGELLKDFLASFKCNLEARLEARLEESGKSAAEEASEEEIAAMQQELIPVNEKGVTAFELLVAQGWNRKDAEVKARQLKYDSEEARWYISNERGFKHYWSL